MTSPLFAAYRGLTTLCEPAGRLFLAWRLRRGKEDPDRIGERLGRSDLVRPAGRLVWIHGASVGEGLSVLPLVEALASCGWQVLVTTGTLNAARVLAERLPDGVLHQFVPLDFPGAVRRFLRGWQPDVVLLVESELWPNVMHAIGRAGIRLALVNARMSERSARRWSRASGFIGSVLAPVDLCLCQTEEDAARFAALGAGTVAVTGFLKFDVPPPAADPSASAALARAIGSRPVWVAASTHADEESHLVEAHARLARALPTVLTILVPRQPDRGEALTEAARRGGIATAQRSHGEPIGPDTGLLVADTVGELGLFYRAARVVYVGKSLVAPGGGQNPIEPAKLGCAILHGPFVENFVDIYAALDAVQGALVVASAGALADAVATLMADPKHLDAMTKAATAVVAQASGATARTLAALAGLMPPVAEIGPR